MKKPYHLFIISKFLPVVGGAELLAHRLATALRREGEPVLVLTLDCGGQLGALGRYGKVPVVRLSHPALRIFGGMWAYTKLLLWLCLNRANYHSVFAPTLDLYSLLACVMARALGKTAVARASGAFELDIGILRPGNSLRESLVGLALQQLTAAVAVNRELHARFLSLGVAESRIGDIQNGVAVKAPTVRPCSETGQTVLYVGRIARFKGVEHLVRAWSLVAERLPDSRLLIVGGGEYEAAAKAQVLAAGLGVSVQFAGYVRDPKPWYLRADLFVLPSEKEGMSNSLLEAMSAGLPVVATRITGNEAVITDGVDGVLVPPKDSEALAVAIVALLQDRTRAGTIGQRARETIASRFSLEGMVRRYQAVLGA